MGDQQDAQAELVSQVGEQVQDLDRDVEGGGGFVGDQNGAESTDPPLTSIHQPVEQIGRELARLLIAEISGGAPSRKRVILDTDLAKRRKQTPANLYK